MYYNLDILKALADETRLKIILILLKGEKNVSSMVKLVEKSQPNVSLALKKLEKEGLISSRKDKKMIFYRIEKRDTVQNILKLIANED